MSNDPHPPPPHSPASSSPSGSNDEDEGVNERLTLEPLANDPAVVPSNGRPRTRRMVLN